MRPGRACGSVVPSACHMSGVCTGKFVRIHWRRFMDSQLTGAHSLLCSQKMKIHSKVRAVLLHSALACLLLLEMTVLDLLTDV